MRLALKLDEPKSEQQKHWIHWINAAGDDVSRWRNLARQASAAVKQDGEKQGWRFLLMARDAPNGNVLDGIQKMANELAVWSPDIEEAVEERFGYFLETDPGYDG